LGRDKNFQEGLWKGDGNWHGVKNCSVWSEGPSWSSWPWAGQVWAVSSTRGGRMALSCSCVLSVTVSVLIWTWMPPPPGSLQCPKSPFLWTALWGGGDTPGYQHLCWDKGKPEGRVGGKSFQKTPHSLHWDARALTISF
jgi:hypothetical protein